MTCTKERELDTLPYPRFPLFLFQGVLVGYTALRLT
jgi:hypothetical protein